MSWPRHAVRIRVPATSANLGPGFDALGLALAWYDEVVAEVTGSGLSIEVSGEGADAVDAGEDHLVVRAMRAAFARAGGQPPGLGLRCANAIPQGRGLGSSAAAVVAGLLAARALAGEAGSRGTDPGTGDGLLALAASLEGHPDNAAACLVGGLTIAWTPAARSGPARSGPAVAPAPAGPGPVTSAGPGPVTSAGPGPVTSAGPGPPAPAAAPRAVRLEPLPAIRPVVCVPDISLATTAARRALPQTIPHRDAATSAGRSALLIVALTQRPDLLFDATQDLLHEPYRAPLMAATADLIGRLRAAGIAAVLSGAGPSVLALTVDGRTPGPEEVDSIAAQTGNQWHVTPLDVDRQGATSQSVPLDAAPERARGEDPACTRHRQVSKLGPGGAVGSPP